MEPTGLAISLAGLASIFTSCVDCFEYIQLGRRFGDDYEKCLLRLDAVKLRMTRWGVSVGLGHDLQRQLMFSITEEEYQLARSLLEQIMDSFEDAGKVAQRFQKHAAIRQSDTDDLTILDPTADLEPRFRRLHITMRDLAGKRQSRTSIIKKTTWALYEKKKFDNMISDVSGFVNDLVTLFPIAQKEQRRLCQSEVSNIQDAQDLVLLKGISSEDDELLNDVVTEEMTRRGHTVTDWNVSGHANLWAGDENEYGVESKGHHFSKFTVTDSAVVRLGNVNKGRPS